jgi:hypothetical protein
MEERRDWEDVFREPGWVIVSYADQFGTIPFPPPDMGELFGFQGAGRTGGGQLTAFRMQFSVNGPLAAAGRQRMAGGNGRRIGWEMSGVRHAQIGEDL